MIDFRKIVIIGSGVMGSGIAEQFANADLNVHLFDIVPKDVEDRNLLAKQAIVRISRSLEKADRYIIPGNIEDDLEVIKSADWIIEVIVEKIEFKRDLYKKLAKFCKADAIISSNTSTIELKKLIEGMSDKFKQNFLITHFFNPPRYMQLVEIVTSRYTKKDVAQNVSNFIDIKLGKTPIISNDTPGFIANRIGGFWLQVALNMAIELDISVEEADFLMSSPIGIPKTGVFGLYDLIGIDVMRLIVESLMKNLPVTDEFIKNKKTFPLIDGMIKNGLIGRKGKGGFYRIKKDDKGKKTKEVIDLKTGEYREIHNVNFNFKNIQEVIDNSEYARKVLCKALSYALNLINEVSDNLSDIDQAIKLGFNWKFGPFEMVDQIGADNFKKLLEEQNIAIPQILLQLKSEKFYHDNQQYNVESVVFKNDSASILDLGDGVAAIEITSKMAILDHDVFYAMIEFFTKHYQDFKALVILSSKENFSVGANLKFILEKASSGDYTDLQKYLELGQQAILKLKYSPIPVVSALKGFAYGGGCEILLHSDGVVAHVEASIGLVEARVGLIPGWGGCKEMIFRSHSRQERIEAFKNILLGNIFATPEKIKENFKFKNYLKIMNPNRLLFEAKQYALSLAKAYHVPVPKEAQIIDINWNEVISEMGLSSDQVEVAKYLITIFSSKDLSEESIMKKERELFIALIHNKLTIEKIAMLI